MKRQGSQGYQYSQDRQCSQGSLESYSSSTSQRSRGLNTHQYSRIPQTFSQQGERFNYGNSQQELPYTTSHPGLHRTSHTASSRRSLDWKDLFGIDKSWKVPKVPSSRKKSNAPQTLDQQNKISPDAQPPGKKYIPPRLSTSADPVGHSEASQLPPLSSLQPPSRSVETPGLCETPQSFSQQERTGALSEEKASHLPDSLNLADGRHLQEVGSIKPSRTKDSKKKQKDPNGPKRGKSAFLFFCRDLRPAVLQQKPGLTPTEVSKELGRRWLEMSPEDKTKYLAMAAEDKERYEEEKTRYEKECPKGPKKAKSPYIFFYIEKRAHVIKECPDMKVPEIGKELGRRWNILEPVERSKYVEMAAEDKKRFALEKERFAAKAKEVSKKNDSESKKKSLERVTLESEPVKEGHQEVRMDETTIQNEDSLLPTMTEEGVGSTSNIDFETPATLQRSDIDSTPMPTDLVAPLENTGLMLTESKPSSNVPARKSDLPAENPDQSSPALIVPAKRIRKKTVKRSKVVKKGDMETEVRDSPLILRKRRKSNQEETKEALLRLQKLRVAGTWAMCSITSCSKWRYLAEVLDPSEVVEEFTCRDCPDPRYDRCEAPEQEWDTDLAQHSVETRFTVGSLVWAKMDGFPAWPAMVDDDPNTGEFFWTERTEDGWQQRPTSYHVIFFDEKVVRNWIPCSRLTKFDLTKPNVPKNVLGSRLLKAFTRAVEAAGERLEVRREKYCFARLYQGQWGPVWQQCGHERTDLHLDVNEVSINLLSPGDENTGDPPNPVREAAAKTQGGKVGGTNESDKENCPPPQNLASLYSDSSVFTQELSQPLPSSIILDREKKMRSGPTKAISPPRDDDLLSLSLSQESFPSPDISQSQADYLLTLHFNQEQKNKNKSVSSKESPQPREDGLLSISFSQEEEHEFNPDLAKLVDEAVQSTRFFTPLKRAPNLTSTPVREVIPDTDEDASSDNSIELELSFS